MWFPICLVYSSCISSQYHRFPPFSVLACTQWLDISRSLFQFSVERILPTPVIVILWLAWMLLAIMGRIVGMVSATYVQLSEWEYLFPHYLVKPLNRVDSIFSPHLPTPLKCITSVSPILFDMVKATDILPFPTIPLILHIWILMGSLLSLNLQRSTYLLATCNLPYIHNHFS